MKCKFFFWVMLLAFANGLARNSNGFVDCGGLFLIDIPDKHLSAWSCGAESELQVRNLLVDASVRHIHYRESAHFDGTPKYGWDANLERSFELAQVGVSTEYRFINLRADFSTLPYVAGTVGWHLPDSLLFASASLGRGQFDVGDIVWHLEDSPSYLQDLEVDWQLRFLKHHYSLGTVLAGRRVQADLIGLRNRPDVEGRYGLTLSDTSDVRVWSLRYTHEGVNGGVNLWLLHAWGNITLEGLHRERIDDNTVDEKRFLYVPLDFSASLAMLEMYFMRRPAVNRNDRISLMLAYAWLEAHLPYISWKEGRFYPTVAPNQVLDNSVVKLISLNVYHSSFRVYGDAEIPVWLASGRYTWGFEGPGWKFHPSVALYGFYTDDDIQFNRRIEKKAFLGVKAKEDSLHWNLAVAGGVLSLDCMVDSPRERFFAKARVMQIVPVYYKKRDLNAVEEENEEPPPPEPEPGPEPSPEEPDTDEGGENYRIFRNGFGAELSIGIRF